MTARNCLRYVSFSLTHHNSLKMAKHFEIKKKSLILIEIHVLCLKTERKIPLNIQNVILYICTEFQSKTLILILIKNVGTMGILI